MEINTDTDTTNSNKGTGAGGANTNKNGKSFEEKTNNESRLLNKGFIRENINIGNKAKTNYYLKSPDNGDIIYLTQGAMKSYFETFFNIKMCRNPDEAYLCKSGDKYILKVLEKKNQNNPGSVDTKLLSGPGFIEEYKFILGDKFDIKYAFCISSYLKEEYNSDKIKYQALRATNKKYDISVLFGDDPDYYDKLDEWINI